MKDLKTTPPYALLLLVLALPLWPFLSQSGLLLQHDIFASDLLHSQFPLRAYLGRQVAGGDLPLWLPDVYSGTPLLAQIEAGVLFPPNLVLFSLLDPYHALNVIIVLTFLFGAFGTFLLAREYGADHISASLAGMVFALCGFNVSHVKHLLMHEAAAFLPWLVFFLEKMLRHRGRHWPLLLSLFLALQVFSGGIQIVYYTLLFLALRFLAYLVQETWRRAKNDEAREPLAALARNTFTFGTSLLLGLGLAGVQLMTTYRLSGYSLRGNLDWQFAAAFPYHLPDLLTFLYPHANGTFESLTYEGTIWWENYGYFGAAPLVLVLISVVLLRKRRAALFYFGAMICALVLVTGPATPLYQFLWKFLPGMKFFRFPTRFLVVVSLAAALLAALTAAVIARRAAERFSPSWAKALLITLFFLTAGDLHYWQSQRMPSDRMEFWRKPGPLVEAIKARGGEGRVYTFNGQDAWKRATVNSRGFSKGFAAYRDAWRVPYGNALLLHGLASVEGYMAMPGQRTANFWTWTNTSWTERFYQPPKYDARAGRISRKFSSLLNAAHVRYVIIPGPVQNKGYRFLAADGPYRLYENTSALPRAYLAYRWQPVAEMKSAARWLFDPAHNHVPAIESAVAATGTRSPPVQPVAAEVLSPQHYSFTARPERDCYLVWTDSYDPGWQVEVDGTPSPVLNANGYQMAVFLPAGSSQAVFRYRPAGLTAGLALTLCSTAGLLVMAARPRRRPVESPPRG